MSRICLLQWTNSREVSHKNMNIYSFATIFSLLVGIVSYCVYFVYKSGYFVCQNYNPKRERTEIGFDYCNILNDFFHLYAPNVNGQEFDKTEYPWRQYLRDNYLEIKTEFQQYIKFNRIPRIDEIDPVQARIDSHHQQDIPWAVLFLQVFGRDTSKFNYFPKTRQLLSNLSNFNTVTIMFSVLPPLRSLPPHRGFYKGVWRYHLTLFTTKNKKKCVLKVNHGTYLQKYNWIEGEDVIFDDTFLHEAINYSKNESRAILLVDIKRNFHHIFPNTINNILLALAGYHYRVIDAVNAQNNFYREKHEHSRKYW